MAKGDHRAPRKGNSTFESGGGFFLLIAIALCALVLGAVYIAWN